MFEELFPDFLVLSIPLRNKFRGITTREVAIFKGTHGWTEFGPFLEYGDQEAATWLIAALEAANKPWPKIFRDKVSINATLPIVQPSEVSTILERFSGCKTIKIKVDDFDNASLVLEAALNEIPDAKIRLDVNGSWSADQAIRNLNNFYSRFGDIFEYIEQPCSHLDDLALVKSSVDIKIAADESIRKNLSSDFTDLKRFADIAILKWQPVGGFQAAHTLADVIGLPVVISSALETGIGISHGAALAASFDSNTYASGLGTVALFEADICNPAVVAVDGFIDVKRQEPDGYERYLASPERASYWRERILRVLKVLEGLEGLEGQVR